MKQEDEQTLIELVTPQLNRYHFGETVLCPGMFPPGYWKALSKGARTTLGRWISFLVAKGALPLEPCGLNSKRHNQYRKI